MERWIAAIPGDEKTLGLVCHPQYVEEWPQSNERFASLEELLKVHCDYPQGVPEQRNVVGVRGSEDRWVLTPMLTPLRMTGSGDQYTVELTADYPDGPYHIITILELRDDLISKARTYFAKDYDPPEWRARPAKGGC